MSLVVPAEHTDAVQADTDRVERILVVDDDVRLRTLLQRFWKIKALSLKLHMMLPRWIVCYNVNFFH